MWVCCQQDLPHSFLFSHLPLYPPRIWHICIQSPSPDLSQWREIIVCCSCSLLCVCVLSPQASHHYDFLSHMFSNSSPFLGALAPVLFPSQYGLTTYITCYVQCS